MCVSGCMTPIRVTSRTAELLVRPEGTEELDKGGAVAAEKKEEEEEELREEDDVEEEDDEEEEAVSISRRWGCPDAVSMGASE